MRKLEKEYVPYFEIPEDFTDRIEYMLKESNLHRQKTKVYDKLKSIFNIKWETLKYTIYLVPKATPRPRAGMHGVFYVAGASENKSFFRRNFIKHEDITLITTPCKFRCKCFLPIPKSMNKVEKIIAEMGFIYPISKPDWDNLGKTYCDMIQDILLYDDSLIIEGTTIKRYSIKPRIEVEISYMEDFDSDFNRKKILKKGHK